MAMAQEVPADFSDLPLSCPYTISRLLTAAGEPSATWLIRERDQYGEYPHIYAKVCEGVEAATGAKGQPSTYKVIVLSDSGCGTEVINDISPPPVRRTEGEKDDDHVVSRSRRSEPSRWNIHTFLLYTLNPGGCIPYMVITSHCHYDHITGIGKLPPTGGYDHEHVSSTSTSSDKTQDGADRLRTTVLTSSLHKSFVTPYANLQEHSLSASVGLQAPRYSITWAEDLSEATWRWTRPAQKDAGISAAEVAIGARMTMIQTPGHTPDSLSWYDEDLALLFVGDSFYVKESPETRSAPWGPEPPMPTMFDVEGDLADMWESIKKLLRFVRVKNEELKLNHDKHRATTDTVTTTAATDGGGGDDVQKNMIPHGECENGRRRGGLTKRHPSTWYEAIPFFRSRGLAASQSQLGSQSHLPVPHTRYTDDGWVMVDSHPGGGRGGATTPSSQAPPRVQLAAAHTTAGGVDAEAAILSFREFLVLILRDEVPKKRVADGFRGHETWLYDFALEESGGGQVKEEIDDGDDDDADPDAGIGPLSYLRQYSVQAPLTVIEEGKKRISEQEWMGMSEPSSSSSSSSSPS
ncbi:hypothetical protein PV08_07818 [Exophiala spinifera]|uniref:Metallo-beta-lactamase domain-containing protein n=1 Tax=Exophiala spinifera TaxID=91928 RepID=A0A0D1YJC5_9EURO|nr:uncharacterized protein PV08_07818 [Exophiala spinifera]KIW15031.1 hypothetical protein PV08_07818 [Exophiala spinifera]